MMKWLPIILAIVFFKLTVVPSCTAGAPCCVDSEESIPADTDESDTCSLECLCMASGFSIVVPESILVLLSVDQASAYTTHIYQDTYHHLYVSSLWHPPLNSKLIVMG